MYANSNYNTMPYFTDSFLFRIYTKWTGKHSLYFHISPVWFCLTFGQVSLSNNWFFLSDLTSLLLILCFSYIFPIHITLDITCCKPFLFRLTVFWFNSLRFLHYLHNIAQLSLFQVWRQHYSRYIFGWITVSKKNF